MTTEHTESGYAQAVAIAQRKTLLFSAIWFPTLTALGGVAHLLVSLLLQQTLEIGIVFIIIGSVLTLLMWLVTLGKRYSKTPPKSARDMIRLGWALHTNPPFARFCRAAGVLLAITTVVLLFVPMNDASRGVAAPLSALAAVWFFGTAWATSYTQRQLVAAGSADQYATPASR
ncbi:hypothetical protein FDK12_06635 [Arthrobacter sp. NamB2]|uniref:hypothetical protein n=1 Tax=Arthrobacter sp. NamB2 TaxID=2576035 RepID=UPI0010C9E7D5|nr:hypothetical protein [Arthrobacter sp. NamB2]TKV28344.1 hypothetical protein FDK12_06635 [Arthrobacter sp. NamB2]